MAQLKDALNPLKSPNMGAALEFLRFAKGYWWSRWSRTAWLLAAAVLALLLLNLSVNIGLNRWQRWFFDMLERKEAGSLLLATGILAGLIASGATLAVAMVYCRMTLQVRWRQWLTGAFIEQWMARSKTGSSHISEQNSGSPEYRIVEDVRLAIDPVVELSIGFANAAILGVTFAGVLIAVGGAIDVEFFGSRVAIPGYLAFAALFYALIMSTWMYWRGQPLIRRVAEKNEAESQFLFKLTSAAERGIVDRHTDPMAGQFGPASEALQSVVLGWRRVIREHCRLTWVTNSHSFFAPILPLILTAPKYLNGELTLGAVMQAAAAFTIVLGALNWLTDNYVRFAEWSASARRVDELRRMLFEVNAG